MSQFFSVVSEDQARETVKQALQSLDSVAAVLGLAGAVSDLHDRMLTPVGAGELDLIKDRNLVLLLVAVAHHLGDASNTSPVLSLSDTDGAALNFGDSKQVDAYLLRIVGQEAGQYDVCVKALVELGALPRPIDLSSLANADFGSQAVGEIEFCF